MRYIIIFQGKCLFYLDIYYEYILFYFGEQIGKVLTAYLTDTPEELIDELSEYLHRYPQLQIVFFVKVQCILYFSINMQIVVG